MKKTENILYLLAVVLLFVGATFSFINGNMYAGASGCAAGVLFIVCLLLNLKKK